MMEKTDGAKIILEIANKIGRISKKDIKRIEKHKPSSLYWEIQELIVKYFDSLLHCSIFKLINNDVFEKLIMNQNWAQCQENNINLLFSFLQNILKDILCSALQESYEEPLTYISNHIEDFLDISLVTRNSNLNNLREYICKKTKPPIFVYGESSSGKSTTVAYCVYELKESGYSYTWVDFSNVGVNIVNILYSILLDIHSKNHIIVIDNLQAMSSNINSLYKLYEIVKERLSDINLTFIFISWQSTKNSFMDIFSQSDIKFYEFVGNELIKELIKENQLNKYRDDIIHNSNNDVLIAQKTIEYIKKNGKFPTRTEVAEYVYEEFSKGNLALETKKALYILASLGTYEIHVRRAYLENRTSLPAVKELCDKNICRKYIFDNIDEFLFIGHRSLANYIVTYFQDKEKSISIEKPISLAIEYLKKEGHRQFLSTLKRLDREMLMNKKQGIFSIIWESFVKLRNLLYDQIDKDSTWGNNMASMIFAAEALKDMEFETSSNLYLNKTKKSIRERWGATENANGLTYFGDSNGTAEMIDFEVNIRETMHIDESNYNYDDDMQAENLNYNLFHANWLLGLLIGLEGVLEEDKLLKKYIDIARSLQKADGSFYPRRVPWVTSRMIIGLCQAGMTYSDKMVKNACDWLVSQIMPEGKMEWMVKNFNCSGWRSGTGTWNTNENVTLMNLYALFLAKYPIDNNDNLRHIVNTLWEERHKVEEQLIESGRYLDLLWILNVFMLDTRDVMLESNEIFSLINKVLVSWDSATATAAEKQTESSDVSFMVKELIMILWRLLYEHMDELLKKIERPYIMTDEKKKGLTISLQKQINVCNRNNKYIFVSYRSGRGSPDLCLPVYEDVIYLQSKYREKFDVFIDIANFDEKFDQEIETAINDNNCIGAFVYLSDEYLNVGAPEDTDRCLKELKLLNCKRFKEQKMFVIPIYLKKNNKLELNIFIKEKMNLMSANTDAVRAEEFVKLLSLNKTYDDIGVAHLTWEEDGKHFEYIKTSNFRSCLKKNGIEI